VHTLSAIVLLTCSIAGLRAQSPGKTPNEPSPNAKQAASDPAAKPDKQASKEKERPFAMHGRVEAKYVGRWAEGAHDNDLLTYASVRFGTTNKDLITLAFSGRGALDLDGKEAAVGAFRSIDDRYSKDLTGRLYTAYAELGGGKRSPLHGYVDRVRAGRQILYDVPQTLYLDGVSIQSSPIPTLWDLVLTGYAGVSNHIFEASSGGDIAAGAGLRVSPWESGTLQFDFMHATDDYLGTTTADDLYGLRLSQRLSEGVQLNGHVNLMGPDARDFGLNLTWADPEGDASLTARYDALFSDQKSRTIDFDYYTTFLSTYYAYHQFELHGHKGFGDSLFIDGGAQVRVLEQESNEGVFNHEFQRYFLTPGVTGWPSEDVTASLTFEYWDSNGDEFGAFGLDVDYEIDPRWTASGGTLFELFRYDSLLDQERQDVQVYFGKLQYKASDSLRFRARLEFEDGDTEDFLTFTLSTTVTF